MATISEALAIAIQHHQAGRLEAAERIYRQILQAEPNQADAWHLLGVIAHQAGKHEVAVQYIGRAIGLNGNAVVFYNNLGGAYRALRKIPEAVASYRRALQLKPDYAEVHHNLGVALSDQRKLDEAVASYRRALQLKPDYAEAHNNLGLALTDQGNLDEAVASYRRALQLKPDYAEAHNNLGVALSDQGDLDETVACYRRALELKADYAEAHNNLGVALSDQGNLDEAVACFRRALELKPDFAGAHNNLGNALKNQGKVDEAAACYRRALELKPDYAEAHNNLGLALKDQGKLDEAVACYRRALELKPDYAEAHYNLGNTSTDQGKLDEAVACYRRALQRRADFAEAYNSLGNALKDQGKLDEAAACYGRVLELKPDYAEAHNNLGLALCDQGKLSEAVACYRRALELKPDLAEAHFNQSLVSLLTGDFQRGWVEYQWRWKTKWFARRDYRQALWDGQPLEGRTILLYAEQGMGDTIQFVRYAALVKQRGGAVIVECARPLLSLLANFPGVDRLLGRGDELPAFDVQAPLLSLPGIFHTSLETIPADVPYLFADPNLLERWRQELGALAGFKIGIAWQGNPGYRGDRHRSIPLGCFEPLARCSGVRLLSLQKHAGVEQLQAVADRFPVIDLGSRLDETSGAFMDTAAVMMNLDLVVTSDTAIAHLAGRWALPSGSRCPLLPTGAGCWTATTAPGIPPCGCSVRRSRGIGEAYSRRSRRRCACSSSPESSRRHSSRLVDRENYFSVLGSPTTIGVSSVLPHSPQLA